MRRFQLATGVLVAFAALIMVAATATEGQAFLEKQELKCSKGLAKSVIKQVSSIVKTTAKCLDGDISGKKVQSCSPLPAKDQSKVDKAIAKVDKTAGKSCASTCSTALDIPCITDLGCPPRNTIGGRCSGKGGKKKFNYTNLGFPGFFCPEAGILNGAPITSADDIALCVKSIGSDLANTLVSNIYGSITSASGVSGDAADCVKELGKTVPKTVASIAKAIGKCRDKQNSLLNPDVDPANCATGDAKTADSIAKASDKLNKAIDKKCTDATLSELDLCGDGVGGTTTVAAAKACLLDVVNGVIESSDLPDNRTIARATLINAAYPDSQQPVCGDNKVNQQPNPFLLLGEECDGTDDSACPGLCAPPGDLWECTCLDIPRIRQLGDGPATDLDSGWTGSSHDSEITALSGYIIEESNCDYTSLTGATCTGTTTDPVCDVFGSNHPFCSHSWGSPLSCDDMGDGNGLQQDTDCQICDSNSVNAGSFCTDDGDCQSQCVDADTKVPVVPQALCSGQSDCGNGEICLGRCDLISYNCVSIPSGAPLPISAGGTAVCVVSLFRSNVTGTQNIVTGEHAMNYQLASFTHFGDTIFKPCPVCGGFCGAGARTGSPCEGTCDVTGNPCRFDSDCTTGGDTTCTTASPACPDSSASGEAGFCNLSLVCSTGSPREGQPCRVEAETPFGTTSGDCLPDNNISGAEGLTINRVPTTSEKVSHGVPGPGQACTAVGFENYDCPCPASPRGNGVPSRPNTCRAACTAPGANFGVGCATGDTNGLLTVCVGGAEDGIPCDEDTDCSGGGTCSGNPTHCTAPAANFQNSCSIDADCDSSAGAGDGICADACPGGRCTPFCVETGTCVGGTKSGFDCGTNADCDGGGVCTGPFNPNEGVCAAGPPFSHCGGLGFDFIVCTAGMVGTQTNCEAGVDGVLGTDDDVPGAGFCIEDVRNCYLTDPVTGEIGSAEGGDIFNGQVDAATNYKTASAYCIPDSTASSVNTTAGLGGPGRQQATGVNVPNFSSIP